MLAPSQPQSASVTHAPTAAGDASSPTIAISQDARPMPVPCPAVRTPVNNATVGWYESWFSREIAHQPSGGIA
jgi:hypothetical protein